MKTKLKGKEVIAVASMLFGLFFGAGNLIFPVHLGQLAGSNAWSAIVGFVITGVGLPLLGVAAAGISHSEGLPDMAGRVGKRWSVFFTSILYLTIGPLFAIPRCATTSFTVGIEPLLNGSNNSLVLLIFSAVFFALVLLFSLKPGKILVWIGKIINPVFLVFLGILTITALVKPLGSISEVVPEESYVTASFFNGFLEGYNTMDALASLAFGIIVIQSIRELGVTKPSSVATNTLKSGIFSCLLMGLIYAMLTIIGAQSRNVFSLSENGGIAFSQIATYYFGNVGQIILAITVFLACLKTSIGLVTSCSETFEKLFPKIHYRVWAVIFCIFPFIISNVGLTTLIQYSVPVLQFLYPLSITLILLNLCGSWFQYDRRIFISVTAFTAVAAFLDLIRALPENICTALHLEVIINFFSSVLPLYSVGMGWVCPAIVGLVLGIGLKLIHPLKSGNA